MAKAGRISIDLSAGTAQFIVDMEKANAKLRDFSSAAHNAGNTVGGHTVSSMSAASAALRTLEGNFTNNIRAAERFIGTTLGLGPMLQAAFPVVGAIALGGALSELVERAGKTYEAFKQMQEAPLRIRTAFLELNGATSLTNDELRVTNDRLASEIAKLEGRPQNALALALDEARVAADKLSLSLDKDIVELNKLLTENAPGVFAKLFGQAGTGDIQKELGGEGGFGGFRERLNTITSEGSERVRAATDAKQKDAAQLEMNTRLQAAYREELERVNQKIRETQGLQAAQAQRQATSQQVGPVIAGVAVQSQGAGANIDYAARLATLQGVRRQLNAQVDFLGLTQQNAGLEGRKATDEARANADALTAPYRDKLHELGAELAGVQTQLAAIGQSQSAEMLAKSWAESEKAIQKLNDELAKHHQALTLDQQVQLVTLYDEIAAAKAESEWQTKLDQTTSSIQNRIQSLRLLTDAIGKTADVQRQARIESQVIQTLGDRYGDPEWMRSHQADVNALRAQVGAQDDAQRGNQTAETVAKLRQQIDLEKALAAVQEQGAEAVRLVTLAYRMRDLAMAGATQEQIRREIELANAQKANQSASNLAKINEQIEATRRLGAAQVEGAEAARRAQLELNYEQMRRQGASPEEIQQTRTRDELQHQQEITAAALQTGIAYGNQLELIDQQVGALERLKASQGDTLAIEISLKNLELERTRVLIDQALQIGTVKDGMIAFFRDLGTEAESSAAKIYGVMKNGVNSLNDTLARAISGQKVSWASFFQGLSAQFAKMALEQAEAPLFAKLGKLLKIPGTPNGQAAGRQPWDEKLPGGIGSGSVPTATTTASAPSTPFGKRDGSSPMLSLYVTVTNAMGQPQPNGWQTASGIVGIVGGALGGLSGGSKGGATMGESFQKRALGGDVNPQSLYLVGERGPELFRPPASGSIIPNDKLGGTHVYYSIDARGSDPALMEQRFRSALGAVHNMAVVNAQRVNQETIKRTPQSARS